MAIGIPIAVILILAYAIAFLIDEPLVARSTAQAPVIFSRACLPHH
jgi:hypothetical protein